ncbi:MAG: hypothetical protein ACK5NT_04280 [Pyrinomonadaceae bacterium]
MTDLFGLLFFVLLGFGIWLALHRLSKPRVSTETEFEGNIAKSTSMLAAGVSALNGLLDPRDARGQITIKELRKGTYNKQKREGKANGNSEEMNGGKED